MKSFLNAYLCLFLFAGSLSAVAFQSKCSANAEDACVLECCEVTCCSDNYSGPAIESTKECCEMSQSDFEIQPFDPAYGPKNSDISKFLSIGSVQTQLSKAPQHSSNPKSFQRPPPNLIEFRNLRI